MFFLIVLTVAIVLPFSQMLCGWEERPDGSHRPTWPWWAVLSTEESVPLHTWLSTWLRNAPRTLEGVPVVSLLYFAHPQVSRLHPDLDGKITRKMVFVKAYLPREGRFTVSG